MRVALVGSGRIAERHAAVVASESLTGIDLVGVCDSDIAKAERLGHRHNVPAFGDADRMVTTVLPDVIAILTESGNHSKNVQQLVKYGKHFVVEKPMALNVNDAEAMISACESAGLRLFVVKQNRYNKAIVALKFALDHSMLGEPFLATVRVRWTRTQEYYDSASWRGTRALDGGVLANQASHHIDILQWLMGPVQSVFADQSRILAKIESHDLALGILRFESGARGLIEATTAVRPSDLEGSVSVLGSRGSVVVGGFSMNKIMTWNVPDAPDPSSSSEENPPDVYGYGHSEFYKMVRNSLSGSTTAIVDGQEGLKTVRLLEALELSSETRQEVSLKNVSEAT